MCEIYTVLYVCSQDIITRIIEMVKLGGNVAQMHYVLKEKRGEITDEISEKPIIRFFKKFCILVMRTQ